MSLNRTDFLACHFDLKNQGWLDINFIRLNVFAVIFAVAASGCGSNVVTPPQTADGVGKGTAKSDQSAIGATADDVLTSAIYQLRPENYGINAATDKPINLLNSWRLKHVDPQSKSQDSVPVAVPNGWITADDDARLVQAKFDAADAVHIRDALFNHVIAGYLSDRGRDELQRVGIVIDFVCRNVSLWKISDIELPLLPYLIMQVGRGTPEDRAWVCAEILKQLRIDSVIIRSKSDRKGTTDKWLLGVIVNKQVYLYDTRLGLPISRGDDPNESNASTLAEIVDHPEWLEQMAVNEPYPLTVDDLRDPAFFVISNTNYWCKRMQNLEQVLPPGDVCVLYDPLADEEGRTGLQQRISSAEGCPIESLKLWQYPHQQLEVARKGSEEVTRELQLLTMTFSLPIPVSFDEKGKPQIGTPERKMQRVRSDQLLGKFAEATTKYLRIRHLEVEPYPPEIERLNRAGAQDAFYWTALCKFELGDFETANELLSDYLKKYDRNGKWFYSAKSLLAQSYGKQNKLPEAIAALERTSSDDPNRQTNALRVKRWNAQKSK